MEAQTVGTAPKTRAVVRATMNVSPQSSATEPNLSPVALNEGIFRVDNNLNDSVQVARFSDFHIHYLMCS